MRKKIIVTGAVLLAALFINQAANARTLEDVLKEKGVITEQDYMEVTKGKPIDYKLGKGFTFTSTSQNAEFQLSMGGRLQARYSFLDKDSGGQDASEWKIRRMKFWMSGYAYTKDLTYLVQTELTSSSTNKFIEHAYLDYKIADEAQVLVGQTKVPFGRQWLNSSGALQFVDRSAVSDFFRPGYDTGMKFHGKVAQGLVNYDLGWYGGKGQGVVTTDNNNALGFRVTIDPLGNMAYGEADLTDTAQPLVSFGFNYFYDVLSKTGNTTMVTNNLNIGLISSITNSNNFDTAEKVDLKLAGFDAAIKWRGFFGLGEYFVGRAQGVNSDGDIRARGYLAQAGYCIIPKTLEVAVRYGYIDPNKDKSDDLRKEVGAAVSYYIFAHNLKVQADGSKIHDDASQTNKDEKQFRIQAQVIF